MTAGYTQTDCWMEIKQPGILLTIARPNKPEPLMNSIMLLEDNNRLESACRLERKSFDSVSLEESADLSLPSASRWAVSLFSRCIDHDEISFVQTSLFVAAPSGLEGCGNITYRKMWVREIVQRFFVVNMPLLAIPALVPAGRLSQGISQSISDYLDNS